MNFIQKMIAVASLAIGPAMVFAAGETVQTAEDLAKEKLCQESIAKMTETAKDKPTQAIVEEKVKRAVALFEKEGPACFPKFKGRDSEFLGHGTYIYIITMDGTMLMDPPLPKMEGKCMISLRDKKGELILAPLIGKIEKDGKGWHSYWWPRPGKEKEYNPEKDQKFCFGQKAVYQDVTYGICCGAYDIVLDNK